MSRKKDAAHMKQRKEIKKLGKKSLKKHYAIFVAACLIASFIGAEFAGSLGFTKAQTEEQAQMCIRDRQEYFPLKVYPLKTAYKQAFGVSIFRCLRVNRIENYL